MVRLLAQSGPGTACTVVDKVRGPFQSSGQVGKGGCDLDLLLDAGSYKLRLESPPRGKGTVAITARPFAEQNPRPVRLEKGRRVEQPLRSGEQASFWLSLKEREVPFLHVLGKNAGEVRLWKNGEWLEPVSFAHTTFSAGPSRAVHEWRFDEMLEPGDYLLTAYGTSVLGGSSGEATDALTVEYGFEPLPPEGAVAFTLPATGTLSFQSERGRGAFLASLDSPPTSPFELLAADLLSPSYLGLRATAEQPLPSERGLFSAAHFTLEPKRLVPQASAAVENDEVHVVTLRGAPGSRGLLEWAPAPRTSTWAGGYYGAAARSLSFNIPTAGDYLIGLHDLPADTDSAPLGCQLEQKNAKAVAVLARDVPSIGGGQQLSRQFNYDGKSAIVWFEITRSDRYRIQTLGDRKNRCEVSRIDAQGVLGRLTQTKPDAKSCSETLQLTAGVYQLSLYDGLSGIEKLVIGEDSQRELKSVPAKAGCLIVAKQLAAGAYNLAVSRGGDLAARGLVLQALPLAPVAPVHLVIDPGRSLALPVAQAAGWLARSAAGKSFECDGKPVSGQCAVHSGTLTLKNPLDEVVSVTLLRPAEPKPLAPLGSFDPKATPLPRTVLDQPVYLDFERGQSHSLVFEVDRAGLYNVTTLGLLATECRLRTPVVPDVAKDAGSGRGRNCLVSGYLRPGRYLLTATTTGQSRGRAGLVMTRRLPREYAAVGSDGETFFSVDAGELAQQRLSVRQSGELRLSTTSQGAALHCRLDDADGWPLSMVPTACSQTRRFKSGSYLWTQLPLTVESMRHTKLEKVRAPLVLKGNKPHPIEFHTFYDAQLGSSGKDEFLFKLEGEAAVEFVLTGGMQGHIYQLSPDQPPRPMEVIPPKPVAPSSDSAAEGRDGEGGEGGEGSAEGRSEGAGEGGEGGEGSGDGAGGDDAPPPPPPPRPGLLHASAAPPLPAGTRVTLPRGQYKLVVEHSRGDVGVQYKLHLGSAVLLPGMARELPTPVVVPVHMPRDGTLRLRTEGEADLLCRLFDGDRLVFESRENAADWNCALAEPLLAGNYRLVLESKTQRPGQTRLALGLAAVEEGGLVKNGATLTLAAAVQSLALPVTAATEPDAVFELGFRAKSAFSCALEDGRGQVVHKKIRVRECELLVRPQTEHFKVRLWTTDGTTQVQESLRSKPVRAGGRGSLPADQASLVAIARAGQYATSPQVFCLSGEARGLLRPCGPQTSLPAGPAVFAAFGSKEQPLPLYEQLVAAGAPTTQPLALSPQPWLQGVGAAKSSVFLLTAEVPHGERTAPACAFETGVRESHERACFAASNVSTAAIAQAWAPGTGSAAPIWAQLTHRAVTVPAQASALPLGRARLALAREGSLFALPADRRARLELTLPGDAWAVLLDEGGHALELCPPAARPTMLSRCVVAGRGGKLLVSSSDPQADVTTLLLEAPERDMTLSSLGLYEDAPRAPGSLRLRVPATGADRVAVVEGEVRCTFIFADGSRVSSCQSTVPRGVAVELKLEHGPGALRVMVYGPGRELWTRLGRPLPPQPGSALPSAVAVPLAGAGAAAGGVDRTLVLAKDAVVRVVADSGVCGLLRGSELLATDGFDSGCELVRLLPAGTYRFLVRPFAGQPLPGTLRWTAEPVSSLGEGIGPEDWLAPAEVRVYRFNTASKGWVGLGVQTPSESLACSIYDAGHHLLGDGCQQYLKLEQGSYLLMIRLPRREGAPPLRFRPVLLGLAGAQAEVPQDYLKDLFRRIGVSP